MKIQLYKYLALLYVLLIIGCKENGSNNSNTSSHEASEDPNEVIISQRQFDEADMLLGSIEEKYFPQLVKSTGYIDVPPQNKAIINAKIGGYIKSTPLLVGDHVKKGQQLVTIENPEFINIQQDYLEVKEQLNFLRSEFERQETLVKENITSQKNYLKAESNYKSAQARYNGLRKQLQMINISPTSVEQGKLTTTVGIYAPISGSITHINVSKGSYVSPSESIMEIIDNDHVHLELKVFEKDIMNVSKGQLIQFRIPEASEKTFKAEVHLVGTSIDEKRTITVHGHPEITKEQFLTGMFVTANIVTDSTKVWALPETAIVESDNLNYVLKLISKESDQLIFQRIPISSSETAKGFMNIELNEQLTLNDEFLVRGAFSLVLD